MATKPTNPAPSSAPAPSGASSPAPAAATSPTPKRIRPRVDWKAVWPIPLALLAAAGLAAGIVFGVLKMPKEDPAEPLLIAQTHYDAGDYLQTLEVLNQDALPFVNAGKMVPKQEEQFFQLRARALYYGQERLGLRDEENFKRIVDAYDQGKRRGMAMEPSDTYNIADSVLELNQVDKALELARTLASTDPDRQLRLFERIIDRELKSASRPAPSVIELLGEMAMMPGLSEDRRAWVASRQAELRLKGGFADEAKVRLLRDLPKFGDISNATRAELLFLLGKAYAMTGEGARAIVYLQEARQLPDGLTEFDDRRGQAMVIEAKIRQGQGENDAARELFAQVQESFEDTASQVAALVGLAETRAATGDTEGSLKTFEQALEIVRDKGPQASITLQSLGERLMDRQQDRRLQQEPMEALAYAQLAHKAFGYLGNVPSDVHLAQAQANRQAADKLLRDVAGDNASLATRREPQTTLPADVSSLTANQAKGYLLDAGEHFRQHAKLILAQNFDGSMGSLLSAGDAFDLAGDYISAIEAFSAFIAAARDEYPGKGEAMFRVAQAHQAMGDYLTASNWYRQLVAARSLFAGPWADKSIVPLAKCIAMDPRAGLELAEAAKAQGQVSTDDKTGTPSEKDRDQAEQVAIRMLRDAAYNGIYFGPDSPERREALIELGELHYRRAEFDQAISALALAVKDPRLAGSSKEVLVVFKLADAYRQRAITLRDSVGRERLDRRAEVIGEQFRNLSEALVLYDRVQNLVLNQRLAKASDLEKLFARNAAFYAGDCLYERGEFEQAVTRYAAARERYANDPAVLVALSQTVSAYIKLGRWEDARAANERAKALLANLPESVWTQENLLLPMTKQHWENWLSSRLELDRRVAAAE